MTVAITFKDWLPDQVDLENDSLEEASNVLPLNGTGLPYRPLTALGATLGGSGKNPVNLFTTDNISGDDYIFGAAYDSAGGALIVYQSAGGAAWTAKSTAAAYSATDYVEFARYEDLVVMAINASGPLQHLTLGSASNFSALGATSPSARHVGVVGQFVVAGMRTGGVDYAASVQWGAIDDPLSWPTPGSNTANASQSGEQFLDAALGVVTGISSGDQYGIIFQEFGATRMTYVGGSTVFQFDKFEIGRGAYYPRSIVKVGGLTYFAGQYGFFVTDGVTVRPIGYLKVDQYFATNVDTSYAAHKFRLFGAADVAKKLIYWGIPTSTSVTGIPNRLLVFNYEENRWANATEVTAALASYPGGTMYGLDSVNRIATLSGTAGTAVITTGEVEPQKGGYSYLSGVKPLIQGNSTHTVAVGYRNDQTSAVTYTSEVTATARTGFSDFRTEARYLRARVTITGTFNSAQGLEFDIQGSGRT